MQLDWKRQPATLASSLLTLIPPLSCQRIIYSCLCATISHGEFGAPPHLSAAVRHTIIGANLLSHFTLLVDMASKKLHDTTTGFFVIKFFPVFLHHAVPCSNPVRTTSRRLQVTHRRPRLDLTGNTHCRTPYYDSWATNSCITSTSRSRKAQDRLSGIRAYVGNWNCPPFFQLLAVRAAHGSQKKPGIGDRLAILGH